MNARAKKQLILSLAIFAATATLAACGPTYVTEEPASYAPSASAYYYYDSDQQVYYYDDPNYGWRYYPGQPPDNAHYWGGSRPGSLPQPPQGFARVQPSSHDTGYHAQSGPPNSPPQGNQGNGSQQHGNNQPPPQGKHYTPPNGNNGGNSGGHAPPAGSPAGHGNPPSGGGDNNNNQNGNKGNDQNQH